MNSFARQSLAADSSLTFDLPSQETEVGANPVQIEVGDFDEAIEIVEDEVAESKFTV